MLKFIVATRWRVDVSKSFKSFEHLKSVIINLNLNSVLTLIDSTSNV